MKKITYNKQYIDKKDLKIIIKALKNKLITSGNFVSLFEKKICHVHVPAEMGHQYALRLLQATMVSYLRQIHQILTDPQEYQNYVHVFAAMMSKILEERPCLKSNRLSMDREATTLQCDAIVC